MAQALGVSPSTVGGWESGRGPSGEFREKYAYLLEGARARLHARAEEAAPSRTSGSRPGSPAARQLAGLLTRRPCTPAARPPQRRPPQRSRRPVPSSASAWSGRRYAVRAAVSSCR
ncbi:hypothetical protein [Streptomyces sp. 142MFCol3.1]|uniref:hypothetical protein n=1 Tax=Streptomyces sp. 142MFCol3.1 TaxID=1172179 RepID=UPI003B63D322